MKDKLKNIFNLSKLYIKENDASLNIINMETKKLNKKSYLFWVYVIIFFGITYLSSEIISYAVKIGKPQIFLNGFLLALEILIIIRTIMVSMNVLYFSKDIENILHLPINPIEILISKFSTILFMNYEFELIFALAPLFIYGIYIYSKITYFLNFIIVLIIFPLFATMIVSIMMIFLMKTIKLFKNKDLMQLIISFILIFALMFGANKAIEYVFNNSEFIEQNQEFVLNKINEKIIKINNYFLNINPSAEILQNNKIIITYLKLILINFVGFILFIFMGNKLYLKQLLKANFYTKKIKKNKKIKIKKSPKGISYIKKEFKMLSKNPIFLIQSIYPVIMMTVLICILTIAVVPAYNGLIQREEYKEIREGLKFNMEAVCIILGILQITGLFNYTSITSFSREGKNAFVMKILPISLYKQFIYKNIPQIILNIISSVVILAVINLQIPAIGLNYILIIFGLSVLLTVINSFILCLIDLIMPKLKWDAEYEILKNSKNKLLQYVLIIFNILFLIFIKDLFEKHNLNISLGVFAGILIFVIIILNSIFYRFKDKLYEKITTI
ncbi:MAG: hypothetical protein IJK18_06720 [Clostridia bacterium]|nr:hypothetical protein [Clostridia bacterium]